MAVTIRSLREQILAYIILLDAQLVKIITDSNYDATLLRSTTGKWDVYTVSRPSGYVAELGLNADVVLHGFRDVMHSSVQPTPEAALQDFLAILHKLVVTTINPRHPFPAAGRTVAQAQRPYDDHAVAEEMAEKTYLSSLAFSGGVRESGNNVVNSAPAKKAVPGKGRQAGNMTKSAKEGGEGKKRKFADEDEDDEEVLPVKQQSPQEKKVKVEGR